MKPNVLINLVLIKKNKCNGAKWCSQLLLFEASSALIFFSVVCALHIHTFVASIGQSAIYFMRWICLPITSLFPCFIVDSESSSVARLLNDRRRKWEKKLFGQCVTLNVDERNRGLWLRTSSTVEDDMYPNYSTEILQTRKRTHMKVRWCFYWLNILFFYS